MDAAPTSWEAKAAAKRESTLARIPAEWRLAPEVVERASRQRDLTGPFIQGLLKPDDVEIVRMDSLPIVDAIMEGRLTAVRVATAFCKAAAVAHQIVREPLLWDEYVVPGLDELIVMLSNCSFREMA